MRLPESSRWPIRSAPPLLLEGRPMDAGAWRFHGAPRALRLHQHLQYGWLPPPLPISAVDVIVPPGDACEGLATRHCLRLSVNAGDRRWSLDVLLVRPKSDQPVPVIVGLNFKGNHTTGFDPAVPVTRARILEPAERGARLGRWDMAQAVRAGFAVATACYEEAHVDSRDPEHIDSEPGVFRDLFGRTHHAERGPHDGGAIAAWAWALHRMVDLLEDVDGIHPDRIAVLGHSRLGKTSLLAAATDPRIALCIDNQSGTGGGALSRKGADSAEAETTARIQTTFPHWFCPAFADLAQRPELLPMDQHHLLAAIAPRPALLCYAEGDRWADPEGSFRCARQAESAWSAFGHSLDMPGNRPGLNQVVGGRLAWHLRAGPHGVTPEDWTVYLAFAKRWLIDYQSLP